jgi:ABC-type nickel/cobalt efflux system permease component RcnA
MNEIAAIQRWFYGGIADGLGQVAGGEASAVFLAMAAAVLFGAVHALMPGHGKTVLVSYHLGQDGKLLHSIVNGSILAVTHVGLALVLVLAGFAVISRAFAYGGRTPQFEIASGVFVALIGAILLWRSLRSDHNRQPRDGGKTLAFVTGLIPCPLTTFILSYAMARGLLAAGIAVTAAMTLGMIFTISGIAFAAALSRRRFMILLDRTEGWRHKVGRLLEIGGSVMVLIFGAWLVMAALMANEAPSLALPS